MSQCLEPEGMLVLNLSCRDSRLRAELVENLKDVWVSVVAFKLEEDVNEVVYCSNTNKLRSVKDTGSREAMGQAFKMVNDHVRKARRNKEDLLDVDDCMKRLTISRGPSKA